MITSEDWSNIRAGHRSWQMQELKLSFSLVQSKLTGDHNEQIDPDWWLKFIHGTHRARCAVARGCHRARGDSVSSDLRLVWYITDSRRSTAFLSDNTPQAVNNLAKLLSTRSWHQSVTGEIKSGQCDFECLPADPLAATRPRITMNPGRFNLSDQVRLVVSRRPVGEQLVNEAHIVWYPPGKDNVLTAVPLPNDYDTWVAGWSPRSTILWVSQKELLRSYDFTDNAPSKKLVMQVRRSPPHRSQPMCVMRFASP